MRPEGVRVFPWVTLLCDLAVLSSLGQMATRIRSGKQSSKTGHKGHLPFEINSLDSQYELI